VQLKLYAEHLIQQWTNSFVTFRTPCQNPCIFPRGLRGNRYHVVHKRSGHRHWTDWRSKPLRRMLATSIVRCEQRRSGHLLRRLSGVCYAAVHAVDGTSITSIRPKPRLDGCKTKTMIRTLRPKTKTLTMSLESSREQD